MTRPSLNDIVASTSDLATLPGTVIQLLDLLEDSTTCAERVQAVLERDPAMTTNVLKLANSAYYGVRRSITSVRQALVLLGNRAVTTLAFATGMAPVLRRDLVVYGVSRESFWRHAVMAAAAAAHAADLRGDSHWRTQAFTAGLVHDIGKLVIDGWLLARGGDLTCPTDATWDVRAAERALLGCDHAEVGAALAEAWGFPEMLVAAIGHHHHPELAPEPGPVVRAVGIADVVACALADDPDDPWRAPVALRLVELGCATTDFEQLRVDLAGNLDETLTAAATPTACLI